MAKTLLILSAGPESGDVASRARELGLGVVMADADAEAPGFAFADSRLIADIHQPAETAAAAERFNRKIRKIDGVMAVGVHVPLTQASVAQRLRLPGIPLHVAELIQDRLASRKTFLSAGIPSPWFAEIATPQQLQQAVVGHGRELILLPIGGDGGAQPLAETQDLAAAFLAARSHSPEERVMVEKCPFAPRLFCESLIRDGHCITPMLADQGREGISRQPAALLDQARALVAAAASALGLGEGSLAVEMSVLDDGLQISDFSASLSGYFATREIPRHTGVDFTGAAIRLALGEPETLLLPG